MPACVHEEQQRGSCGRVLYFLHPSQNHQASSGVTAGFQEKDVLTLPGSAALESHSSGRLTNKLGEQFSNVFVSGPFYIPKNYRGHQKHICLRGLYLSVFNTLDIKMEKFLKCVKTHLLTYFKVYSWLININIFVQITTFSKIKKKW